MMLYLPSPSYVLYERMLHLPNCCTRGNSTLMSPEEAPPLISAVPEDNQPSYLLYQRILYPNICCTRVYSTLISAVPEDTPP
jgi:hypothetical protein